MIGRYSGGAASATSHLRAPTPPPNRCGPSAARNAEQGVAVGIVVAQGSAAECIAQSSSRQRANDRRVLRRVEVAGDGHPARHVRHSFRDRLRPQQPIVQIAIPMGKLPQPLRSRSGRAMPGRGEVCSEERDRLATQFDTQRTKTSCCTYDMLNGAKSRSG